MLSEGAGVGQSEVLGGALCDDGGDLDICSNTPRVPLWVGSNVACCLSSSKPGFDPPPGKFPG